MDKQIKFSGFESKIHRIKEPIIRDGIKFDSNEELEFYMWCVEAKEAGIISNFAYHPEPFLLSEKNEFVKKQTYAPDFILYAAGLHSILINAEIVFFRSKQNPYFLYEAFVEIKGTTGFRATPKSGDISFPIKQAWLYQKAGIFINKVITRHIFNSKGKIIHPGFFSKTWVPKEVAWMKARKEPTRIKAFADCKLLAEVLQ